MGWTLGKNIGFCLGRQEEGLRGPAGEGSSTRIPSCSQFPPSRTGFELLLVQEPFLKDLTSALSSCLLSLPLCSGGFLSVHSPFVRKGGEWDSELEESRRRHWGEKRDLGLSSPLCFLLKSGLDSVGLLAGHLALTQANLHRLHP